MSAMCSQNTHQLSDKGWIDEKKKLQIATLEKHSALFKKILKQCSKLLHLVKNIQGENSAYKLSKAFYWLLLFFI